MGQTVVKSNAEKVRRLAKGEVIAGFAGATADAFTLFERLEAKLEQYPGQLARACVELAKDWRTDRYLRRLEAMLLVADKTSRLHRHRRRRRAGAGQSSAVDGDRLGRQLRARRRPRAHGHRLGRRGDRPTRHGHRRRHLRLHQRQSDRRKRSDLDDVNSRRAKSFPSSTGSSSGRREAKRAVAIALRNRWRRRRVPDAHARRDHAEEHPDDRPDRRRQDRDRAPPGQARAARRS